MAVNLLVAHGGGPTAVINASLAGVIRRARQEKEIGRVLAARHGIEGVLKEDLIDLTGLSEAELDKLSVTPGSAIGSCRYKMQDGDHETVVRVLDRNNVGIFLYNGGNDSMDTCMQIAALTDRTQVIGIPKTIDNDLARTDHSPGFGSAARYYAITALELCLDVAALNIHVAILEIMGRNAGWTAAAAGLALRIGSIGPEIILLPEKPFEEEAFLDRIRDLWARQRGFVVAVSEGLADKDGNPLVSTVDRSGADAFGHALPGNVSHYLAQLITSRLGYRARSEKPGLVGRVSAACVSPIDRKEAYGVGVHAVSSALQGASGSMVAIRRISSSRYTSEFELVPLSEVANVERKMPEEYFNAETGRPTSGFVDYCMPLIGGDLPDYLILDQ
jgi:6-phosphofructokinase